MEKNNIERQDDEIMFLKRQRFRSSSKKADKDEFSIKLQDKIQVKEIEDEQIKPTVKIFKITNNKKFVSNVKTRGRRKKEITIVISDNKLKPKKRGPKKATEKLKLQTTKEMNHKKIKENLLDYDKFLQEFAIIDDGSKESASLNDKNGKKLVSTNKVNNNHNKNDTDVPVNSELIIWSKKERTPASAINKKKNVSMVKLKVKRTKLEEKENTNESIVKKNHENDLSSSNKKIKVSAINNFIK